MARASGEYETVVADRLAALQHDMPFGAGDGGDPRSRHQLDRRPFVEYSGAQAQRVLRHRVGEELLRQRRAMIRQPRLFADQHHTAVEFSLPQRGGDLKARVSRAYDYNRSLHHGDSRPAGAQE